MIDFYFHYNNKNFQKKISKLIVDIERLFTLFSIEPVNSNTIFLNTDYKIHLDEKTWIKINNLYSTIEEIPKGTYQPIDKFRNKKDSIIKDGPAFIDVFAGAGGLSLGLEDAGFENIATNEIVPEFLETYYLNRNIDLSNLHCGDIKDFDINNFKGLNNGEVSLVVGGPPCQGFSNANRQRLIDDPRNHLYKYFIEFINMVSPKFFIMENVRGMLNKGDEIMDDFSNKLGHNYQTTIFMLNAKEFGLPQHRERVFLIGTKDKNVDLNEVKEELLNTKAEEHIPIKDALYGLPKLGNKEKKGGYVENDSVGYKFRINPVDQKDSNAYLDTINKSQSNLLSNHMNRYNNPRDVEIFTLLPQGKDSTHESIKEIMPYVSRTGAFKDKYFKLRENHVSKTITAHMDKDCNSYIHPNQPRGLSPREAARIQSFPDDYIFMGPKNKWYTQIGNAVPPQLAKVLGKTLIKYLT